MCGSAEQFSLRGRSARHSNEGQCRKHAKCGSLRGGPGVRSCGHGAPGKSWSAHAPLGGKRPPRALSADRFFRVRGSQARTRQNALPYPETMHRPGPVSSHAISLCARKNRNANSHTNLPLSLATVHLYIRKLFFAFLPCLVRPLFLLSFFSFF